MRATRLVLATICVAAATLVPATLSAQGTVADYQRAMGLRDKYQALAVNVPEPATWIEKSTRFWYRRSVRGGNEFILVDAATQQKRPPFDHQKLADALTAAIKPEKPYTATMLPFVTFTFVDGDRAIELSVAGRRGAAASPTTPAARTIGAAGAGAAAAGAAVSRGR
jgi:hypothetical protein